MMPILRSTALMLFLFLAVRSEAAECGNQSSHPEWIFCDDFESTGPMVGPGRYFEYNDNAGDFAAVAGVGRQGSRGMRVRWQTAEIDAGNLKVSFGRTPNPSWDKGIRPGASFREIYYRVYLRTQPGWKGDPYKLSRATVLAKSDWSQAMIAHLWGDRAEHLQLDPVRCVDGASLVKCSGYNDFTHMEWIGAKAGPTAVFDPQNSGKWVCVEAHVKLNDAGQSNGVHEFWIDERLEARREGLNFLGSYKDYGLNAVFLENYWNSGSPQLQERYLDDFVISTARIGCESAPAGILPARRGDAGGNPATPVVLLGLGAAKSAAPRLGRVDGKVISTPGPEASKDGASRAAEAAGYYVGLPEGR